MKSIPAFHPKPTGISRRWRGGLAGKKAADLRRTSERARARASSGLLPRRVTRPTERNLAVDDTDDLPEADRCTMPMHSCIVSSYCFAPRAYSAACTDYSNRLVSLVFDWDTLWLLTITAPSAAASSRSSSARNYERLSVFFLASFITFP